MESIKKIQERYEELNTKRIKNALAMMSEQGRSIFSLVPLMLHYNHPLIPGFLEGDVPHGIYKFKPNAHQLQFLTTLSQASGKFSGFRTSDESILALYCMGSTSSIGQGIRSDVDYWVCVSHLLSEEKIKLLEKKCHFIEDMALRRNVEINFFIVKDDKFKQKNSEITRGDSCGSAQHMFLLDEFYRTSIYIAGKKLLWMIVPASKEHCYSEYLKELSQSNDINLNDWIDFGCIGDIPLNEYYGSALWLMYKGIDSPFKAVLKILLIEAYSAEFPSTQLLSLQIKDWMHNHSGYQLDLDAYYQVYKKVSEYLESIDDQSRLYLLRICFYQKLSDGVNNQPETDIVRERKLLLNQLVNEWGWSKFETDFIANQNNWHITEIRTIHNMIFKALMESYRALLLFGINNNISDSIRVVDVSILSRKLYIAFDKHPYKLPIYELNMGRDFYESDLTFIDVRGSSIFKDGWYLYSGALEPNNLLGKRPLVYYPDLGSLLIFSYFNKIIDSQTKFYIRSQNTSVTKQFIDSFYHDVNEWFGDDNRKITNNDLLRNPEVLKIGLFINYSLDPTSTSDYVHVGRSSKNVNVFSYGVNHKSMVGSILVVLKNSWNEIYSYNYDGENAVFNFLSDIPHYIHKGDILNPKWSVFNYSKHMKAYIVNQVNELFEKSINGIKAKKKISFDIRIAENNYHIFFDEIYSEISLKIDDNEQDIVAELYAEKKVYIPQLIEQNIIMGYIQFFFVKLPSGSYDIYEIDENKGYKVYRSFSGSISEFVASINIYYSKKINKVHGENIKYRQYFNLPLYYDVDLNSGVINPLIF